MSRRIGQHAARRLTLPLGAAEVTVLAVDRLEDAVDAGALLRDEDAPDPPYWMHLWAGSRCLARHVAAAGSWKGRRVIEIGCGLALPGIVAAMRGAAVTLMDGVVDALRFARETAALNACRADLVCGDIHRPGVAGRFDHCLAADVTYEPALQEAVAVFLAERLAPTGRAWCAESVRTVDSGLRRACENMGLRVVEWEVREMEEGHAVPVRMTEVSRL